MIGIGITTRNRSKVLNWCLKHFETYNSSLLNKIVIVDDNSSDEHRHINKNISEKFNYFYNEERKGIAGSKNVCLKNLEECEYVFLFDDDCFPKANNWDIPFTSLISLGIQHSSYCMFLGNGHNEKLIDEKEYVVYDKGQGMCLFFTRECLKNIGDYDENFGIYGYEHSDMSLRAKKAGFCKDFPSPYIVPQKACDYIYSLDFSVNWFNLLTDLGPFDFEFKSSINKDDSIKDYIQKSEKVFNLKYS